MLINRISIYDNFSCLMGKCSISCCRGWNIPVDNDIIQKYNSISGQDKIKFMRALSKYQEMTVFKSRFCRCPFWDKDGLCSIQKSRGEQFMPRVCVIFPRSLYNTGFYSEEALYLACPGAAKLFIDKARNGEHFYYAGTEGTPDYEVNSTNDDREFFDYLISTRAKIVNALNGSLSFDSLSLLKYANAAQIACTTNASLPDFNDYINSNSGQLTMDYKCFNNILMNGFYHPRLLPRLPLLYRLCRIFFKMFPASVKKSPEKANAKFNALKKNLIKKVPEWDTIVSRYFEYYILKSFLVIFEDYSFAKNIFIGIIKTHMITVFMALFMKNKDGVTNDEIADVIAAFERRTETLDSSYINSLLSDALQEL